MEAQKHRFVVDSGGKRTSALLPIEEYEKLMEESEELEAIQAYDAAKASDEEAIPFEQAVTEIEHGRHEISVLHEIVPGEVDRGDEVVSLNKIATVGLIVLTLTTSVLADEEKAAPAAA